MASVRYCVLPFALGLSLVRPALAQEQILAPDLPTKVAGVEAVCTGVGLNAREDPRWNAYSLKIEIAGPGGQYLGDEHVTLRRAGQEPALLSCAGPWILFQLPAGRYEVEVRIDNQTVSSPAFVPATGQGRVILRFADEVKPASDKAVTAYPMNYANEAPLALGVRQGRWDVVQQPWRPGGLIPRASGGIAKGGARLQLQWKLGN